MMSRAITKAGKRCKTTYDPAKAYEPFCFRHNDQSAKKNSKVNEQMILGNVMIVPKIAPFNTSSWEFRGKVGVTKNQVEKIIQDTIELNEDRIVRDKQEIVRVAGPSSSTKVWVGRLIFEGDKRPQFGQFLN
jgi:hypothetical protein